MNNTSESRWIRTTVEDGVATIRIDREPVNALIPEVISQLRSELRNVESRVGAVIMTGTGPFFSFGFDVPHMLEWPRIEFGSFVRGFCDLYRDIFVYPKPVVAALNGHAVAGGCMLMLAADVRIMADTRAKVSLNEITFGAAVFAGAVEMLRLLVDGGTAARVLGSGALYAAQEALSMGLVDQVVPLDALVTTARETALQRSRNADAFAVIKKLLRRPSAERMSALEDASIEAFLDVWYSPHTQRQLPGIEIRRRA